ncbi:methyltransferase domain-containing protein [Actinocrispum sp. NPDC049592]|uniref:class I SAM-dependent methyltransferase n=1 Tax=Actinocrispum sp. NPDC049592 TaxID=3154835 RepID=UPI0034254740
MDVETTRTSWTKLAAEYTKRVEQFTEVEQAELNAFVKQVTGPMADIGCGPGVTTAYLHRQGADIFGIDLSPGMLAVARETHPEIRFDEGTMFALDLAGNSLAGIVSWYSIVNLPPESLPAAFAEFHRVLSPGGLLLLAFRFGQNEIQHYDSGYGIDDISLDFHRHAVDDVQAKLAKAGFSLLSQRLKGPDEDQPTPQAILLSTAV